MLTQPGPPAPTMPQGPRRSSRVGLVAAIPAVVIFNMFTRAINGYRGLVADGYVEGARIYLDDGDGILDDGDGATVVFGTVTV